MGRNFDYPMPAEGRMARQQLARIAMDSAKLHNALRDDDDLPAWVLLKINTAEDRLHVAADYLRYKVAPGLDAYNGFGSASRGYGEDSGERWERKQREKAEASARFKRKADVLVACAVVAGIVGYQLVNAAEKKAARGGR